MLQYYLKYETIRTAMPNFFIICLFTRFSLSYFTPTFSLSFISSFLLAFEFFSLADLAEAVDLAEAAYLAEAIVVLHSSLFTLILFLSHPQAAWSQSHLKPPQAAKTDLTWSKLHEVDLAAWAVSLFDLGWVLRFVNVVGYGLVVVVVLWLWRQFGGCGGDY